MHLDSIATRTAVTLGLAVVLTVLLIIFFGVSGEYWLNRVQGHSDTQVFVGRFFFGSLNRHRAPQVLSSQIATVAGAVARASPSDRAALMTALADPSLRIEMRDTPTLAVNHGSERTDLVQNMIEFLLQSAPGGVRVVTRPRVTEQRDIRVPDDLVAEIATSDGKWIVVTASSFTLKSGLPMFLLSILVPFILLIAVISVWTARRLTRPISAFAAAAERFGASTEAIPLAESGPRELRAATRTFNQMQERLRRFISDRTLMVAAMSHDLKTPLTRLRLRAELIGDETQQGKMMADIDEMAVMIESTLAFAQDDAKREVPLLVDLGALVESACENAIDTGHDVDMSPARQMVLVTCRPVAISRAVTNLIDNAVKYGDAARVTLDCVAGRAVVTIDDDGPGIPESEREKVFAPFYRLEGSRNRRPEASASVLRLPALPHASMAGTLHLAPPRAAACGRGWNCRSWSRIAA